MARYVRIEDFADAVRVHPDYLRDYFYELDAPYVDIDSLLNGDNMTLWDLSMDQGELYEDILKRVRRIDPKLIKAEQCNSRI